MRNVRLRIYANGSVVCVACDRILAWTAAYVEDPAAFVEVLHRCPGKQPRTTAQAASSSAP